jgi:hypothetical protein
MPLLTLAGAALPGLIVERGASTEPFVRALPSQWPQGPFDSGAGGNGCPPGPAAVSGDTASCLSWHFRMLWSNAPPATCRGDACFARRGLALPWAISVTGLEKVVSPVR